MDKLPFGTSLEVETESRVYRIETKGDGEVIISGHPRHCPTGITVMVGGVPGSKKGSCIAPGSRFRYLHPDHGLISTSPVRSVTQIPAGR